MVFTTDWPAGIVALTIADEDPGSPRYQLFRKLWEPDPFNATSSGATTAIPFHVVGGSFGYVIAARISGYPRPTIYGAVFTVDAMIAGILPRLREFETDVRVFDVTDNDEPVLLHSTDREWETPLGEPSPSRHRHVVSEELEFVDRNLLMEVKSSRPLSDVIPGRVDMVWGVGAAAMVVFPVMVVMGVYLSELSRQKELLNTETEATKEANQGLLFYLFHEIRNSLHVLRSLGDEIRSERTLDQTAQSLFRESVTHISHLVESLSPEEQAEKRLMPRITPLLPVVRDLLVKHRSAMCATGDYVLELDPALLKNGWVDRSMFQQVLEGSLRWTLHHGTHGDVSVRLSSISMEANGQILHGRSIPGEQLETSAESSIVARQHAGETVAVAKQAPGDASSNVYRYRSADDAVVHPDAPKDCYIDVTDDQGGSSLLREGSTNPSPAPSVVPVPARVSHEDESSESLPTPNTYFRKYAAENTAPEALLVEMEYRCLSSSRSIPELKQQLPAPDPRLRRKLLSMWDSRDLS